MAQRIFLVDCEASGLTPHSGVMTEFGIVDFETRDWFHGRLWDFHPDPTIPAIPVPERENPGVRVKHPGSSEPLSAMSWPGRFRGKAGPALVFGALAHWIAIRTVFGEHRAVFVSDNPAYHWMWMADGFDRHGIENPFGYSARRIGDLAARLSGNWKNTSGWKNHRDTVHDHNPVNDALGNAEALHHILLKHHQIKES
jgi:hypothetical protein